MRLRRIPRQRHIQEPIFAECFPVQCPRAGCLTVLCIWLSLAAPFPTSFWDSMNLHTGANVLKVPPPANWQMRNCCHNESEATATLLVRNSKNTALNRSNGMKLTAITNVMQADVLDLARILLVTEGLQKHLSSDVGTSKRVHSDRSSGRESFIT